MTTPRLRYEIKRTTQDMRVVVNLYFHLKGEAEAANEKHTKSDYFFKIAKMLNIPYHTVVMTIKTKENSQPFISPIRQGKENVHSQMRTHSRKILLRIRYIGTSVQEIQEDNDTLQFKGTATSLRKLVKRMAFKWGKGDSLKRSRESETIITKWLSFVRPYAKLLEENCQKFIFLDERGYI